MATALQCWVYHRGIFMFMLYMHSSQLSRSHGFTAVPTTVSLYVCSMGSVSGKLWAGLSEAEGEARLR